MQEGEEERALECEVQRMKLLNRHKYNWLARGSRLHELLVMYRLEKVIAN